MKTEQLILTGDGYALAITQEAEAFKAGLLAKSATVATVDSAPTSEVASAILRDLAGFRNTLEKSRKAVKEPVLKVGSEIDAKAREFGEAVAAEESRVKALVEAYAMEQHRKQQAAAREQARLAEEARQRQIAEERAAIEAERAALAAERAKMAAECAASPEAIAAAKAANDAREQAEYEAEMSRIERESAQEVAVAAVFSAPVIDAPKAKASLDYEVVDIRQFADAYPQLVTITPKRAEILAMLKLLPDDMEPAIPGLVVSRKFTAATR